MFCIYSKIIAWISVCIDRYQHQTSNNYQKQEKGWVIFPLIFFEVHATMAVIVAAINSMLGTIVLKPVSSCALTINNVASLISL